MKLRQKLAMVLAAAMVVTAVPVVTMAASSNRVTKTIVVADDAVLGSKAPNVMIDLTDGLTKGEFYINLEGAEWTEETTTVSILGMTNAPAITATKVNSKQMRVEVAGNVNAKAQVKVALGNTKVTGDEAKVIIDGNDTEITGSTLVFASKNSQKAEVIVDKAPAFYTGTELALAPITVEEVVAGTLVEGEKVTVELNTTDFKFESTNKKQNVTLNGVRGFKYKNQTVEMNIIDDQTAEFTMPKVDASWSKGGVKISGLTVKSTVKKPSIGDLTAEVYGDKINDKEIVVAKIAEYGAEFKVKEVKETAAGKTEKVKVTLKEVTADSFTNGTVEITAEGGFLAKVPAGWEAVYKDEKTTDKIIGMTKKISVDTTNNKDNIDTILNEQELEIYTELGAKGDVTLTATGRAIGEDMELIIAKATPDFEVKATPMNVEVGVKAQQGGKIQITETDKETFKRGTVITVELPADSDVEFTKKPEISATGDMKVSVSEIKTKTVENKNGRKETVPFVEVTVEKASKEAATITVENFTIKTDRTVADGSYDAKILVKDRKGVATVENFLVVGEGVASKITTTITNGATEMIVNGAKVTLEAPAYIKNGKLMTPLRAVSEAFGIKGKDIVYNASSKEIVIFANGRTIQLAIGSKDAFVNGAKMTLANPAEIVNGRTTVPVGDLGRLLGLAVEWNNATKTATFKN